MNIDDIMLIKGAISGAITDAESKEAVAHAEKYYGFIRSINYDVDKIARNTKFTVDQIKLIKRYIFYDEHQLEIGNDRFAPDFFMAQSWRRLAFEPQNIQPHDIMLIEHEMHEMFLVLQGYPQQKAHDMTNEMGYNYESMCIEYYKELEEKQNNKKHNKNVDGTSSGTGITVNCENRPTDIEHD